jgi:NADH-quinone oxidoreductase subunit E
MEVKMNEHDIKDIVRSSIARRGKTREALISILSDVNQAYGFIPGEAFTEVKRQINQPGDDGPGFVSESQLFGLATFYQMLSTKPVGRHVIRFCESAPCHVMGGREVFQALKDELQLQPGETSPDGRWTLVTTSCLGACGVGPVLLVDEDIYGNVAPKQLSEILNRYE